MVFTVSIGWTQKDYEGNFYLKNYLLGNSTSTEKVGLFVKGNLPEIKTLVRNSNGIYRGSVKGWHYVRIPSNELQNFVENDNLSQVNFRAYQGRPLNDTMRVNNRINDIHNGTSPLSSSYEGDGIILGFIDTGIDFLHPDFMNPDSSTRIMYLWDQTKSVNQYTPSYGYGQHWDSTEINQGLSTNQDQWGHGSTVAGAACGNAFANGKNKGVAPKTDIIAVESNFGASDWLSTVVDAVEYIYNIADSIGKPCVINASIGTYYGSHDGLDPYALYIDSLINSKKGHLLVAAAGNSGAIGPYHLHTEISDTSMTWFQVNPSSFFGFPSVFFEVWADTADFNNVNFSIGADKISPFHDLRGKGAFHTIQGNVNSVIYDTVKNSNNDVLATVQYWTELRDGQYLIQVYMPEPDSAQYYYRFETTGTGSYDTWTTSVFGNSDMENRADTIVGFNELNKYVFPDTLQTIVSSFQCSPHTITVANYANDSGWVNKYGGWEAVPTETRGKLAASSSKGPTRTGLMKPEIAATGVVTNSAYPLFRIAQMVANNTDTVLALGGMHYRNGGTSMSSPIVAGVAALFLEKCPQGTPTDFNSALINNAYTDNFTGTVPNYAYGYGKLDGFATLVDANFTATYTGNSLICQGDSNLFTITSPNVSYNWETGETVSSNYLSDSTGTYFLVTDLTTGCISDTANIFTSIAPKPIVNCINTYDLCENSSLEITETGVFNSILWNDGSTLNPRTFYQSYTGFVLGLDTNNCKSDTCFVSITEQPNPAQPTITNNNTILSSSVGYDNYQWYVDGMLINGANDSIHTALQNGNYQVEVFNSFGCSSFSDISVISTVGINEFDNLLGTIFPNPNNGNFTVKVNQTGATLKLYSSDGKLISSEKLSKAFIYTYKNLALGTYYLNISIGKNILVKKIVVLK